MKINTGLIITGGTYSSSLTALDGNYNNALVVGVNGNLNLSNGVIIGNNAGSSMILNNIYATSSVFIGECAGSLNISSENNIFIGYRSGRITTVGKNVFIGSESAYYNDSGANGTFIGYRSGYSNTSSDNVFIGHESGYFNTTGTPNTFIGYQSGYTNISGQSNTFVGYKSGCVNTASCNSFFGHASGYSNTTGAENTFLGYFAGLVNTVGGGNVYVGYAAGQNATNGGNVFIGDAAGSNSTGGSNVLIGYNTHYRPTSGTGNTIIGANSGDIASGSSGDYNTLIGMNSGYYGVGSGNIAIGSGTLFQSFIGASDNIAIGYRSGYNNTVSNNLFIGYCSGGSNTTGTPNTFIGNYAGVSNISGSSNTYIGYSSGNLGTQSSFNTFIGDYSGYCNRGYCNTHIGYQSGFSGSQSSIVENTFIGFKSGYSNGSGCYNTYFGHQSGYLGTQSSSNTFIGYKAGYSETGSNKLYISNSGTSSPLIYGDFSSNHITINGSFSVSGISGTTSRMIETDSSGNISASKQLTSLIIDVMVNDSQGRNLTTGTWSGSTFDRDGVEGQWGFSGNYEYRCVSSFGLWARYPNNKSYQDLFITDSVIIDSLTNELNWNDYNEYSGTNSTILSSLYNGQQYISEFYGYKYFVYDIQNKKITRDITFDSNILKQYAISSNKLLDFKIPGGFRLTSLVVQETMGNTVSGVAFGSSTYSCDIVGTQSSVGSYNLWDCDITTSIFNMYLNQGVYINATDWGTPSATASLNVYARIERFAK